VSSTPEELGDLIHRALTHGIKLPKMSKKEMEDYLLDLSHHINKTNIFRAAYANYNITIETKYLDPILMIRIRKDTLEFLPLSESNFFDSFMSVLEYISLKKMEKDIMKEFKVFVDEVDKDLLNDEQETEEIEIPGKDDDFDWI
tara:strand:- start:5881 stop:6312 length:432 start_codon:yes stop_codon:yes gene_type:complete